MDGPAPVKEGPTTALGVLAEPARRYWLYALWYVLAALAAAGFWANLHHLSRTEVPRLTAYLVACGAALFLPGLVIAAGAVAARLTPRRHRTLLDVWFVVLAALAVATIITGRLGTTPILILLIGNAIWSLDTLERRTRRRARTTAAGATPGPKEAQADSAKLAE